MREIRTLRLTRRGLETEQMTRLRGTLARKGRTGLASQGLELPPRLSSTLPGRRDTFEGWLYLATIKDIFTKEIVGWATDNNMRKELCIKALENAVRRHKPPRGTIHYSDRGVQYCSREYQATL